MDFTSMKTLVIPLKFMPIFTSYTYFYKYNDFKRYTIFVFCKFYEELLSHGFK